MTVKTIRLYHEKGLLIPRYVDEATGYRYFDDRNADQARAIAYLREMTFPLTEIKEIVDRFEEDADIVSFLEKQRELIQTRIRQLDRIAVSLDDIIRTEKEVKAMIRKKDLEAGEKDLQELLVAGLRWKGRYADTGKTLQQVARLAGRHIRGKPINLYFDGEYKEDDADIESCFPVSEIREAGALSVHTLPAGRCVYVVHKGPYDQIGRSYARVMDYVQRMNDRPLVPSREIYLKGPGMIFRGNPRNYLTEIQIMIENPKEAHNESAGA